MDKLQDYLQQMQDTYQAITDQNKAIHALRTGDSMYGFTYLVALPNPPRRLLKDGTTRLRKRDYARLEKLLSEWDYKALEEGKVRVNLFERPRYDLLHGENLSLEALHEVLEGKAACIWYNSFDPC